MTAPRSRYRTLVLTATRRPGQGWPLLLRLSLVLAVLAPRPAHGDARGEAIIKEMDARFTGARDQRFTFDVITQEPGKAQRTMRIATVIKGKEWRRVDFLAPGDVKGMKVLILALDQTYIYLPQYRKLRRVASHARAQGFMGTTYSHDDMSIVTFGDLFEGKLLAEQKDSYTVECNLRPGKSYGYKKLVFVVSKQYRVPTEIRYFSPSGVHVKTETRGKYQCKGIVCQPFEMTLTDHSKSGAWTKFVTLKWGVNTGVDDGFFTPRAIQRSN